MWKFGKREGFSLLEVIIVIAIMAILSGALLGYNRKSSRQLELYSSQAKVAGFLNRAKAFALEKNLVRGGGDACVFGVRFEEPNRMAIFKKTECPAGGLAYSSGADSDIETIFLDGAAAFTSLPCALNNCYVIFEPPYLVTHRADSIGLIKLGIPGQNIFLCVRVTEGGAIFADNCD